jgi:hypothetical protein
VSAVNRARVVVALLAAIAVLTGCGVPLQDSATAVPGVSPPPSPAPSSPFAGTADVWFVADGQLVPADEPVEDNVSSAELIDRLAAGPPEGSPASWRSLVADPLGGGSLITVPGDPAPVPPGGLVTVQAAPTFSNMAASEQVLLIGQVVLTLTGSGANQVLFVDEEGAPQALRAPDGRLLDGPATRADYLPLTEPPPSPAPTRS